MSKTMSKTMRTSNNKSTYPSLSATVTGTALGCASYLGISTAKTVTNKIPTALIRKLNRNNNLETLRLNLSKALNISGLKQHNVKINDYTSKAPRDINVYKENIRLKLKASLKDKNIFQKLKIYQQYCKELVIAIFMTKVVNGEQACFDVKKNSVHLNIQKRGLAGFHELGHAINYNKSRIWRIIRKSKKNKKYTIPILALTAILKSKKADNETPKNFVDSTTAFIRNNVGKLAFLFMMPTLCEEAKASLNGNKLAKLTCSKELYKKVLKSNFFAGSTYLQRALATSIGLWALVKVKDSITEASIRNHN